MRAQKRVKAREEAETFAKTLNLPDKVMLLNKDSTNLEELEEIPDNSIDLIITDPPYLKGYLPVFEGLARFAVRKLKEGGSLIFYFGTPHLPETISLFSKYEEHGLSFAWQLAIIHTGSQSRFHSLGVQVGWKPMLWYMKRPKNSNSGSRYDSHKPAWQPDFCDVIQSAQPDKVAHDWAQSPVEAEYIIKNLTINEHSLVVDPFLGSGAFVIPAIKQGRYVIGIELDKDTYERARNYIIKETSEKSLLS
jgi:DNA modification methylase